ncbi:LysR family transcriptional regulator, partial [Klebsiella pneumoniae]
SLAGAAELLGVNQSTVFRRLGAMEDRLGARLFERSRTGYSLTPAGEEMVKLANKMADEIVDFERRLT